MRNSVRIAAISVAVHPSHAATRRSSRNSGWEYCSGSGMRLPDHPGVRRGTPARLTSAPKVWLWPTCFPPPKGRLERLLSVGADLSNKLSRPVRCGLARPCLRFLNIELSDLAPEEVPPPVAAAL